MNDRYNWEFAAILFIGMAIWVVIISAIQWAP